MRFRDGTTAGLAAIHRGAAEAAELSNAGQAVIACSHETSPFLIMPRDDALRRTLGEDVRTRMRTYHHYIQSLPAGPVAGWSGLTFLDLLPPSEGWARGEDWFVEFDRACYGVLTDKGRRKPLARQCASRSSTGADSVVCRLHGYSRRCPPRALRTGNRAPPPLFPAVSNSVAASRSNSAPAAAPAGRATIPFRACLPASSAEWPGGRGLPMPQK